jgi:hypothetical protein
MPLLLVEWGEYLLFWTCCVRLIPTLCWIPTKKE